jgi:O-succinylbenzoic acid--CoA ligase
MGGQATFQGVQAELWLLRAARRHPERRAIDDVTYAELLARVDDAARRLAGAGVGPGDRVAIALPPPAPPSAASRVTLAFCEALHACLRLGAVAVPVDVRAGPAERAAVAEGAALVVDGLLEAPVADAALRDTIDLDATAVVVHTSGTTAAPRAIELTAGNWLWSALGSAVALGLDPAERWLCALPLAHVGGLSVILRSAIYGTTALVHERFETERVLAALRAPDGPTLVSLVPTTLRRLLDAGLERPPALRWALVGGAPVPDALLARAADAGVPVAPTYGLTEACSQVTTLGVPLFCTRVELAPDDGEVLVAGPTVAPAAACAPERSELGRPVLRTGDLGAWGPDGALRIVGRKADTIVSGGENVAPAEVEAVLEAHPGVAEAAVHGRPDPEWGERVVATVVPLDGQLASLGGTGGLRAEELRAWCAARLAPAKVPKEVAFADALPRTRSGKLERRRL